MTIRVVVAKRPPLLSVARAPDGKPIFSGYLWELLPTLLEQANMTEAPTVYLHDAGSGSLRSNGTWSGIMGQLTTGKADLALFPMTLTTERAAAISHTGPFMADGYGLVTTQQQTGGGYVSFLQPFEPTLWVLILATIIFTSLLLFVVDHIARRTRMRAYATTHDESRVHDRRARDRLMDHAMANFMMAYGAGEAPRTHSISIKVWAVAWGFFCVIILNSYTANLAASLTAKQLQGSLSSLSDLAQSGGQFGVPADSSVSHYFTTSSDDLARQLRPRMIEYDSYQAGTQAIRDGSVSAFVCDFPDATYLTQVPPCDLTVGSQTIGSGQLVLALPKKSNLTAKLDAALLQLNEAGYLAVLKRRWFADASGCKKSDSDNVSNKSRLSINDLWSVFMIPAAGLVLTFLVLAAEYVYYRKYHQGVHHLKTEVSTRGISSILSRKGGSERSFNRLQHAPHMQHGMPGSSSGGSGGRFCKDADVELGTKDLCEKETKGGSGPKLAVLGAKEGGSVTFSGLYGSSTGTDIKGGSSSGSEADRRM